LREDIHRDLMRLHVEHGQRGLALKQYAHCCEILQRELDVSPAPETEQLHEQIRDQDLTPTKTAESSSYDRPQAIAQLPIAPGELGDRIPPDKPSIAVLPFENLSGDPEKQYFSDGISSDIVVALGRFRNLFVISDKSSFACRDSRLPVQQVGRHLGVRHVLKGTVRAVDRRIRVSATLVDACSGEAVWAESYDRLLGDVFAVQDEITRSIAASLVGRIEAENSTRASQAASPPLSVYEYLLRGRHHLARGSRDDVLKARAIFEQALALDPNHASTHIELAHTYWIELGSSWSPAPSLAGERLFELARRAVALDHLDSRGHVMLAGAHYRVKGNYELAAAQFETATTLNPNDYWSYCSKGFFLACSGRLDEGISCENYALRLNPLVPDACLYAIGVAHFHAGRCDEALAAFGRMSNVPIPIQGYVAACYAQLGRGEEARGAAAEFLQRAKAEFTAHPGEDIKRWRAFWMRVIPVKQTSAREHLFMGLRKAGLPA
jgi:adenylate cyclase